VSRIWIEYIDDDPGACAEVDQVTGFNIIGTTGDRFLVDSTVAAALVSGGGFEAADAPTYTPTDEFLNRQYEYPQRLVKRSSGAGAFAGGVDRQIGRNVPACAEGETVLLGHDTADDWVATDDWEEAA
jgi:hypothetical protein